MADSVFNYVSTNPFGLSDMSSNASPILIDIDGDSDLDIFVGNGDGNIFFFEIQEQLTARSLLLQLLILLV